jgi:hypothetical protein
MVADDLNAARDVGRVDGLVIEQLVESDAVLGRVAVGAAAAGGGLEAEP